MKKSLLFLLFLAGTIFSSTAHAGLFGGDACGCEVEKECYGCAANKPEVLVKLTPCAYKDKPYNYYTWTKTAEKVVSSDRYDWAAEAEEGSY